MPDIPFPRGVSDLLPNEALFRNETLNKIEDIFQRFGFLSIDTPTFEHLNVLKAKGGIGDEAKLIFELKDDNLGLRYDNTVSLARYMGMHQELPLPFKRYYIGKVWRREEPQRMRFREITQADVDIVGGREPFTDAEVIATGATAIESIGLDYSIELNDRRLVELAFEKFGVEMELFSGIERAIDKTEKMGEEKVAELLKGLGLSAELIDQVVGFVNTKGSNEEKLTYAEGILGDREMTGVLRGVLDLVKRYNIRGECRLNFSLMRGLDYYTGIVFEYKPVNGDKSSIAAGGRYDTLIGMYSGKSLPAVGVSLGIDRMLELLSFSESTQYSYSKVFVAVVSDANYNYALNVANQLRANGIPTDINLAGRNLSNQLAYANSLKIAYAIMIGDAEEKTGKLRLRNLISGDEQNMGLDEAIKMLKKD